MKFKTTLIIWAIISIVFFITYNIGMNISNTFRFGGLYDWMGNTGEWWRVVTYGFLHNSISHFFGNLFVGVLIMLYMENKVGGFKTSIIFFLGIIIGGIGFLLLNTQLRVITVGASAGIWSLFGASVIGILSKEKINLIEFLVLFNASVLLMYNSTIATNINNISHYTGYLGGFFIMAIWVVIKDEKVFKKYLGLG